MDLGRLAVPVADGDLALGVGPKPGDTDLLTELGMADEEPVGQRQGEGRELRGLDGGVLEAYARFLRVWS